MQNKCKFSGSDTVPMRNGHTDYDASPAHQCPICQQQSQQCAGGLLGCPEFHYLASDIIVGDFNCRH